ncbi:hypothetical protein [Paraburkholderia aromaticivorans]|uniref:hypothetical protein n=1 Tax=Paraburkholderia aromaticivorans TaxID=2026199 RepID=UPI0014561C80|nr:hypothetical protein [Paraburkholderia aromaticivorans]
MQVLDLVLWCLGGACLANAVPHCVSGLMGRAFQTPFARPRGKGNSSSTANVCWGFVNLLAGYLLLCRVGNFDVRAGIDMLAAALGALLLSLYLARRFGRFNGGNRPEEA